MSSSRDSRISGLYRLGVRDRIDALLKRGWLTDASARELLDGRQVMLAVAADKVIENVIGVFGLPLAIAPNFIVNGREIIVPLVVEEPSIVAALSGAAALARASGGFSASLDESLLTGQIHVARLTDIEVALSKLQGASDELLRLADSIHPRLHARGGGVREIGFRKLALANGESVLTVHVHVDTCDAMGANLVNTICEAIAPRIQVLCGGEIALRILSNLAERSVCSATVRYRVSDLATDDMPGEDVRDRIILANDIALADPARAVTHNKGVMNGIDALAIATGNDWRAIEAGAHAYAARDGRYAALTSWSTDSSGDLVGRIELALKPGIVGGTLSSNPAAELALAITGVESAPQLAELMAAVGLAQNFAALRALASSGIQKGHMRLHARSLAAAAGAPAHVLDDVVEKLIASGEVKDWKAAEILAELTRGRAAAVGDEATAATGRAAGKVILFGEHAVVYGRRALALPIPDAVAASAVVSDSRTSLVIPEWGVDLAVDRDATEGLDGAVNLILSKLGVPDTEFSVRVHSRLPRGMGMGSSAAIAVAISRAIAACMKLEVSDEAVNTIAFECEKLAHGNPSGVDNTVSCFAAPILFSNVGTLDHEVLQLQEAPPLVIAYGQQSGSTLEQVAAVRARREANEQLFDSLFDQIDAFSRKGAAALLEKDYATVGELMNLCHGILNGIGVSTPDLENMLAIARDNGALGAKLTGAGGGGSIVALCPDAEERVCAALQAAGYTCMRVSNAGGDSGE